MSVVSASVPVAMLGLVHRALLLRRISVGCVTCLRRYRLDRAPVPHAVKGADTVAVRW